MSFMIDDVRSAFRELSKVSFVPYTEYSVLFSPMADFNDELNIWEKFQLDLNEHDILLEEVR
jgi:hypothetical protein